MESIIQVSPIGKILVDSSGLIRMVNPQAEAMFGYGAKELVGRSVEQLLPDRFRSGHAELRRRFLSAPTARPMGQGRELFAKRKDGTEFPVEIALSPVSTFAGKPTLASIIDISERKASVRLLQGRAKQQAAVADLGQFALEVSDLDQIMNQAVVRMSEALEVEFCKILELDGTQLKLRAGVGWREGLVGSAIVGTEVTSQAGFTLMCHSPVIVADLQSEPRFSAPALLTDHGVVSGMSCIIAGGLDSPYGVLGAHTAQKRTFLEDDVHFLESIANVVAQSVQRFYAETERKRIVDQLRSSRDTFLNMIQNNPFGVYLVDSNFRLAQVSTGSQKIFRNVNPLIGRDLVEVLRIIWPEPFASHAIDRFCHTLATGEPYHSRGTTIHRRDTADVESYDWRLERVTLPDGHPGVVCYFYDITERVLHEQEIHRLKDELEARVTERTHELMEKQDQLRTMAAELTLTEQRERRRLASELHDYLAQLLVVCRMKLSQAERQFRPDSDATWLKEIDQILDQSLTYTRSLVAELSPEVLYQFGLPKALEWLGEQMLQHGLVVRVESETDSLPLSEERAVLLFQSVRELLFNVIKHAETDHAAVSLTKLSNGEICIRVSDEGQGFELAASTMPAGHRSVPMCFGHISIQERMKALNGRLDIDSSPGHGTTVTLVLPKELAELHQTAQDQDELRSETLPRAQRAEHSRKQTRSKVRILLVDDHAMVREGLRISLESNSSLEVIGEASNGMEALTMVRELHPDVVIMDVNTDGINGIESTQRLRTEFPATRVIGLSVNADKFTRDAMLDAGASMFLSKHAPAHQLCDAIESLVQNQASQR
jgi:PAS domain S-box-containing protein